MSQLNPYHTKFSHRSRENTLKHNSPVLDLAILRVPIDESFWGSPPDAKNSKGPVLLPQMPFPLPWRHRHPLWRPDQGPLRPSSCKRRRALSGGISIYLYIYMCVCYVGMYVCMYIDRYILYVYIYMIYAWIIEYMYLDILYVRLNMHM